LNSPSSCLCLQRARITGVHHHTRLWNEIFKSAERKNPACQHKCSIWGKIPCKNESEIKTFSDKRNIIGCIASRSVVRKRSLISLKYKTL
jgi:hypothetical protein